MRQPERNKSSLFLMELVINLLLFCILCGCGLMFFIKSTNLTRSTTDLHQAVRITTSIASAFEAGDGTLNSLQSVHPACFYTNKDVTDANAVDTNAMEANMPEAILYYNEDFKPCSETHSYYKVTIDLTEGTVHKATIVFYNEKGEAIYSIDAFHYAPYTLSDVEEVPES